MNILVVGCGKVGSQLSNILSSMGHDTAVIDPDPASFERLSDDFRGYTVAGVRSIRRCCAEEVLRRATRWPRSQRTTIQM